MGIRILNSRLEIASGCLFNDKIKNTLGGVNYSLRITLLCI